MKSHPLFEGINFKNLYNVSPPAVDIHSPFRKKKPQNQSLIQESFAEEIEDLELEQQMKLSLSRDLLSEQKRSIESIQNSSSNQIRVILSGLVNKKCGWLFYKPRQLILTDTPKLIYYDPTNNSIKVVDLLAINNDFRARLN